MKKTLTLGLGVGLVLLAAWLGPLAAHHLLPLSWTGEGARLAQVIGAAEGRRIAEIGAGSGGMARELANIVGPAGRLYVTETAPDKLEALRRMALDEHLGQLIVVDAAAGATNLPTACCSAVYMRHVLHHIDDWPRYAVDLARTVAPGGVAAVIDFAPGALPHLPRDHGADPESIIAAFTKSQWRLEQRVGHWGGRTYLLAFRRVD